MTSEQIQCFFKVAELESFTAAADAMYMTQPSLSKRISALESELKVTLFDRDKSKKLKLTKQGQVIYDGLKKAAVQVHDIINEARNIEKGMTGSVRLGIFENQIIDDNLRKILNDFSEKYHQIDLYVTTDSFNGLIEKVNHGQLDCAVTIGYDLVGREKINHRLLYHLKTNLVVPKHFPGDVWKAYALKDFADLPFLTIHKENNHFQDRMIRNAMKNAGIEPTFIEAYDEKNFMMMLEMGKGIGILDVYSKCCYSPNVVCIPVPEIGPTPFELVWLDKNRNPAFECFLEHLAVSDYHFE